ncbi:MAG: phosphate ABC transporter permease PstA [Polyangiaceae bacterium]|nr:phosphate ABC transporter permease PstA [Polyangiaceae bacterium]
MSTPPPRVERDALGIERVKSRRDLFDRILIGTSLAALVLPLFALLVLFGDVFGDALPRLHWDFLSSYPSRHAAQAGILPAFVGTLCLMVLTAAMTVPIGIGAAIYLEEYAKQNWFSRLIELNIANLAGVPSIIYGLLGLELFVRALEWGRSLLAGAATLSLLVLPIVILASREALRTVPASVREAAWALGAGRWAALSRVIVPMCLPGMLTGVILAMARAIGETAPLITIGALTYVAFLPDSLNSPFTALPIQVFNWVSRPQSEFHTNAAAGIVVLLVVMLTLNAVAIRLRMRLQKRYQW